MVFLLLRAVTSLRHFAPISLRFEGGDQLVRLTA
jgi:hypothetical protein